VKCRNTHLTFHVERDKHDCVTVKIEEPAIVSDAAYVGVVQAVDDKTLHTLEYYTVADIEPWSRHVLPLLSARHGTVSKSAT
jgi:hypothetical protein